MPPATGPHPGPRLAASLRELAIAMRADVAVLAIADAVEDPGSAVTLRPAWVYLARRGRAAPAAVAVPVPLADAFPDGRGRRPVVRSSGEPTQLDAALLPGAGSTILAAFGPGTSIRGLVGFGSRASGRAWSTVERAAVFLVAAAVEASQLSGAQGPLGAAADDDTTLRVVGAMARRYERVIRLLGGHAAALLDGSGTPDGPHDEVAELLEALRGAQELTQLLLACGRSAPLTCEIVDLRDVVDRAAAALRRVVPPRIEVVSDRPSHPCLAWVDAAQLETAVMQVAVNGMEAIAARGVLLIGVSRSRPGNASASDPGPGERRPHVAVRVADTGEGMDQETVRRSREPFFSSRPGRRAGLGLSAAIGIVEQSGGHVELTSTVGRGTTVLLLFPRVERPRQSVEPTRDDVIPSRSGP